MEVRKNKAKNIKTDDMQMKRLFIICMAIATACFSMFGLAACKEDVSDKYVVTFSLAWKEGAESGTFSIDGNTKFDKVILNEGEMLGERLPDLSKIPERDLMPDIYGFKVEYWYFLVNDQKVVVDKNTVFDEKTLGVGVGKTIPLKIYYKVDSSPFV